LENGCAMNALPSDHQIELACGVGAERLPAEHRMRAMTVLPAGFCDSRHAASSRSPARRPSQQACPPNSLTAQVEEVPGKQRPSLQDANVPSLFDDELDVRLRGILNECHGARQTGRNEISPELRQGR
jgi:hypothetical protein